MIEIVYGTMKSGKSKAIFDLVDKLNYTNKKYEIFRSTVDTRNDGLYSRRYNFELPVSKISVPEQMLVRNNDVYIIDEIQFFSDDLINVSIQLCEQGKYVYGAGLNTDINNNLFETTNKLINVADKITRLEAICEMEDCNNIAVYNRLVDCGNIIHPDNNIIIDDGSVEYKVFCRYHG